MLTPTKASLKFLKSLHLKKNRDKSNSFIIEGEKLLEEVIKNAEGSLKEVYSSEDSFEELKCDVFKINEKDLAQISSFKSPNKYLALVNKFDFSNLGKDFFNQGFHLLLDDVKDPGNLGTIIRIADWFGFKSVICSLKTVDVYNPKVVQSSMGAVFRIPVLYKNLSTFIKNHESKVFVTDLKGEDIYINKNVKNNNAFVVMGSESHGVSDEVKLFSYYKIKIPSYGGSESLNVGVATGVICAEFRRRSSY